MDTQATRTTPDQPWTVDDLIFSIRAVDAPPHRSRRRAAALGTLVIGIAAAAVLGSSADRAPATRAAAHEALPAQVATMAPSVAAPHASTASVAGHVPAHGRSVVVVMPADHDLVSASSIPVAGMAFARPHGPRIRSVHVDLYVGGRLIDGTDLDVYSGRFAGVLGIEAPVDHADAELRFSDPANPSKPATVRSITIDAPASTTKR